MKIRRIDIRGFRSLKKTQVTGLMSKNIFYGDNGSGKSNVLLALETIFKSKQLEPGISVEGEAIGDSQPRRSTPFWRGEIPNFGDDFYMGGGDPISFEVFLKVVTSFFAGLDEDGILESLEEDGHEFRVRLHGDIKRRENAGCNGASKS